jgi:hypothetical protein
LDQGTSPQHFQLHRPRFDIETYRNNTKVQHALFHILAPAHRGTVQRGWLNHVAWYRQLKTPGPVHFLIYLGTPSPAMCSTPISQDRTAHAISRPDQPRGAGFLYARARCPQVHVDKAGSYAMVTAACVYRVTLYASERSVSGNQHLTGSNLSMRWYNQLWYIIEMLVPVRQSVQQILAFTETSRREDFWSGCMTSMSAT